MSKIPSRSGFLTSMRSSFNGYRWAPMVSSSIISAGTSRTASGGCFFSSFADYSPKSTLSPLGSAYREGDFSLSHLFGGRRFYSTDYPSHRKVPLPALSPTMESGTIVSWIKKEGDFLSEGDLLCEIETDKATMGFETPEEGYLAKIIIPEGAKDIPIGKLLCIIVEIESDVSAFKDFLDSGNEPPVENAPEDTAIKAFENLSTTPVASSPIKSVPEPLPPLIDQPISIKTSRTMATPYAKKLAAEKGVDLATLRGSGPDGRILALDVTSVPSIPAPVSTVGPLSYKDVPLSSMRKTIAKRLFESKSTIPHYYLTSEIDVDQLIKMREKLNKLLASTAVDSESGPRKLSLNDFVIKAAALSCVRVPETNSFFMDTFVRMNDSVDVSVAVSTDVGLITPIVFGAHSKGLATIAGDIAQLARRAREGKLQPHEFTGGTFTVSNLGMFGSVRNFSAIINPPQSCILAVGGSFTKLVPDADTGYRQMTVMQVTLSCDHRVVDGAVGAQWLKHFKTFLEKPHTMLL